MGQPSFLVGSMVVVRPSVRKHSKSPRSTPSDITTIFDVVIAHSLEMLGDALSGIDLSGLVALPGEENCTDRTSQAQSHA